MTLSIAAITLDCRNAADLGAFWSAVFEQPLDAEPAPNQFFASIGRSPESTSTGPTMMFIAVPEAKTAKNRMHLDLQADDREAEVARLVDLGATVVHDKDEWETRWTTLTDPEGNEFCVAKH